MKTQIFTDGNKRASVIFANHYMISQGQVLLVIPESHVPEFKRLLVEHSEGNDEGEIKEFKRPVHIDMLRIFFEIFNYLRMSILSFISASREIFIS